MERECQSNAGLDSWCSIKRLLRHCKVMGSYFCLAWTVSNERLLQEIAAFVSDDHCDTSCWCRLDAGTGRRVLVGVPNLKSCRFFEVLAPLVQHQFFFTPACS